MKFCTVNRSPVIIQCVLV